MVSHDLLTDPESIRSNQDGHITKEQYNLAKAKLGSLPGGLTVLIMAALLVLAVLLAGKTLAASTPLAIAALVGVILVTVAITSFLGGILGGLRMGGTSVEQVAGQVVWTKQRQYAAVAGGRQLEPITNALKLQPGDYIFYRLRGTNCLLSARPAGEAAGHDAAAPADLQSLRALADQPLDFDPHAEPARAAERLVQLQQAMQTLGAGSASGASQPEAADVMRRIAGQMTPLVQGQNVLNLARLTRDAVHESELAARPPLDREGAAQLNGALEQTGVRRSSALGANLAGKQSGGQRLGLAREIASSLTWAALFGAGWLALTYVFVTRGQWTSVLVVTAFFLIVLAVTLSGVRKELTDFLTGRVQVEEGPVTKTTRHYGVGNHTRTHFFFEVNQASLEVSQSAYNALIEGLYRVCFLPNSHELVNIDPLPAASR